MTRDRKGQTLTHFPDASSPLLLSLIASIASNLVFLMTACSLPLPTAGNDYHHSASLGRLQRMRREAYLPESRNSDILRPR